MNPKCPQCGYTYAVHYSGTKERQCSRCWHIYKWPLDKGQVPLAANNRLKKPRKEKRGKQ